MSSTSLTEGMHMNPNAIGFWTLANALTIFRIVVAVPFLAVFPWIAGNEASHPWSIVGGWIMIVAGITDHLDGRVARRNGQGDGIGKLLDPMADKVFTNVAWLVLGVMGRLPPAFVVMAVAMLTRDFVVEFFRNVAAQRGCLMGAESLGKWKTVSQIVAICGLVFYYPGGGWFPVREIGLTAMALGTALSLASWYRYYDLCFGSRRP